MSKEKNGNVMQWVHTVIGIALMFGIQLLPPVEPITQIGMQIGGIFIGSIYLWSTVGLFWPSLLAVIALGFTDYTDSYSMLGAFAGYLPMLMLFCMIFFGAIGDCGLTKYIGRWFLTRKMINGRPSVFNFCFFAAMFVASAFIDPLMALLVLWPTLYAILEEVGYTKDDAYYKIMIVATFIAIALGQCTLPFFGGQLVILGAFEAASGIATNYGAYIMYNIVISVIIMLAMTLFIKFVLRPDMSKMQNISIEQLDRESLPPMNLQQKIYIGAALAFLVAALAPSVLPADMWLVVFLDNLNLVGFTMLAIVVLAIVKVDGEPVLDLQRICKEYVMWDLYLLVVVAVFFSGALMAEETGIRPWLVGLLYPIFGGHGQMFFIVCITIIGVIVTNVANNAITGAILMQIVVALSPSMGITNPVPLAMMLTIAMFMAMLTPAASPYAAVLHANKERISSGEVLKYGGILIAMTIVVFIVIGLPLAGIIF